MMSRVPRNSSSLQIMFHFDTHTSDHLIFTRHIRLVSLSMHDVQLDVPTVSVLWYPYECVHINAVWRWDNFWWFLILKSNLKWVFFDQHHALPDRFWRERAHFSVPFGSFANFECADECNYSFISMFFSLLFLNWGCQSSKSMFTWIWVVVSPNVCLIDSVVSVSWPLWSSGWRWMCSI